MDQSSGVENLISLKKKKSKSLFTAFVIIASGFLVEVFSVATSRQISCLLYYFNWHHWPWWYALNLWIVAIGAVMNSFVLQGERRFILQAFVFTAVLCVTGVCSDWLHPFSYRIFCFFKWFYFSVVRRYLYTPVTEFFSCGFVSILLFSVLVLLLLVGALVLWRRCRNGSPRKESRESEGELNGKN